MAVCIHQIFYDDAQRPALDPAFSPYDNRANPNPAWREYHVFRTAWLAGICRDGDVTGFLSWKFGAKTGLQGTQFIRFIEQNPGYDVYFAHPFHLEPQAFPNIWKQAERHHPGILFLAQRIFDAVGVRIDLAEFDQPREQILFCNYWAGTRRFWDTYMAFCEPVYRHILDGLNAEDQRLIWSRADREIEASYVPFIMERLFSTLLALDPSVRALGLDVEHATRSPWRRTDDRDSTPFRPADEFTGIRALVRDQSVAPDSFNSVISRHDEMLLYTLDATKGNHHLSYLDYFCAGRRIVDTFRRLADWYFGGFRKVPLFLDFASGYGRSIRYLVQELPPERVWVCDIYADAMEFQRRMHGVHAVVSVSDPDAFPPPDLPADPGFDCITAVSFFSHVPKETFARWMARLYGLLAPGGMLAFSVHDISMTEPPSGPDKDFVFFPNSESLSLDVQEYGTTYVSEHAVREIIRHVLPAHVVVHRIPKGLSYYQDVYVVCDDPVRAAKRLVFHHHPQGWVQATAIGTSGNLELSGWAADPNPGGRIEEIRVSVNGQVVQRCMPYVTMPDVAATVGDFARLSGWWCQVGREQFKTGDVVIVKAINTAGLEKVLVADTLERLVSR